MNIRDINHNTNRPENAQAQAVSGANGVGAAGNGQQAASQRQAANVEDRLELSDAARAAYSKQQQQAADLAQAREALEALPSLGGDRLAEIKARLESGYYTRPEVTAQIAERLTSEITESL